MARLCVGRCFIFHVNSWSVLAILFGLTLSSQFEIEISELVEDFKDNTEEYFFEKHNIARRAASNVSLTTSSTPPSAIPPSKTTSFVTGRPSPYITTSKKPPTTSKKPPITSKKPPITSKKPPITSKKPPITSKKPPITSKKPPITSNKPSTTSKKPPTTTPKLTVTTGEGTTPDHVRQTTLSPSEKPDYVKDKHKYYESQYYRNGSQWWFNLDADHSKKPKLHYELSKNIKFSHLLQTSFIFPYYGHLVNNVTITNKGYLFLGERLHKFNASAQYAAPLMADFVPGTHTSIRYLDTGDRLTVEWANMTVRDESPDQQFSFQCTIVKDGTLIFSYKNVPKAVDKLKQNIFFVRVGLSDTYKRERIVYGRHIINGKSYSAVRYIIYYLYDRVELEKKWVVDGAAFIIKPVPNCVMFNSCDTCLNTQTEFDCRWCSKIQRCSDGVDRHRAEWVKAGCVDSSIKLCSPENSNSLNGGVIAVIVILLLVILLAFAWFVYAYSHPQTKSGLCLIKYGNPTKWCRNSSGERQATSTDGRISFKTMSFESNA